MDTDDGDPYVCFRRREVRQIRKTRGRDAQSAEKLKKLRKELEEARQLVALVKQREMIKREQLVTERELFNRRYDLRQLKTKLPEQFKEGDDDLLINQKVRQTTLLNPESKNLQAAAPEEEAPRDRYHAAYSCDSAAYAA